MVYYRQYRPQTIAQLDSPKLRETLTAIFSSKNIPHAFLFTGPKGLGKTSTARIIAKVLNCVGKKRNGIEPCNECDQCVSITNGTNIDVLEIDGASNRGIDEVRELRERIHLAPSAAAKKVYIIDEVHMLTTEAFNALLKTIEEPPAHVVFIFATTEPQKVPSTIISRCIHIALNKATKDEILHALKRIIKEEKITIDDDALTLVAEMGDGGYRDATKMLEEIVAITEGKKITKELVEEKLHVSGSQTLVVNLLEQLKQHNAKSSLEIVTKITQQGIDVKYFLSELLTILHTLLLINVGVSINDTQSVVSLSSLTTEEISTLVQLFSKAYQDTKYAVIPSLPLELAVITYCQDNNNEQRVTGGEGTNELRNSPTHAMSIGMEGSKKPEQGTVSSKTTLQEVLKKEQNLKVKQVLRPSPQTKKESIPSISTQTDLPKDVRDLSVLLENLIYKVKPYNHSVAGVLRGCHIQSVTSDVLLLETPYKFHKEKLEESKIRDILEQVAREVTGKQLRVMVELKG